MKTYQAVFDEKSSEGVFGISLVENPAMEGLFVALNKHQEITLKSLDDEKRILIGLVLEPNKPVYRNQNGEEFNIVFDEDTIRDLSYHFFKAGYQKNSTIEHQDKIEGVTFVESWIVEDSKTDKSALHGFSYPVGSWVATMKVDSDEVWNEYVKSGKVQGFSIDAMLELKEVQLKSDISMSNLILTKLRELKQIALGQEVEETEVIAEEVETTEETTEITLGEVKTADGSVTLMYEGESMEAGGMIYAIGEEGERIPLPVGEYELEDGRMLVVSEEGMIGELKEAMQEAEMSDEATIPVSQVEQAIKSILVKYQEEIKESIKTEFKTLDEKIDKVNEKVIEFSKQPAQKPKRVVQQVELNAKGRILEKLRTA